MNLVTINTNVPGLNIPMVEMKPPSANYRVSVKPNTPLGNYCVAQHAASNKDWDQTARHVISQSGTGVAYAALQRNLRGEYSVRQLGNVKDVADLVGRDNMPKNWKGSTFERGGVACFQWRENISSKGSNGSKQPVNTDWYMSQAWVQTLGNGLYLLSDAQWEFAASGAGRGLDYATLTGQLVGSDGQTLAHCSIVKKQTRTIDVDNPKNSRTPDGIIGMTGSVLEWTDENPAQKYPFGLRGGSYVDGFQGYLRVDFRYGRDPHNRGNDVGVRFGAVVPRTQE